MTNANSDRLDDLLSSIGALRAEIGAVSTLMSHASDGALTEGLAVLTGRWASSIKRIEGDLEAVIETARD